MNDLMNGPESLAPITQLQTVIDEVDRSPFTQKGFDALNAQIETYIGDLIDESGKVARRYRADSISAVHVEKASEHLATGSGIRNFRHAGTIGGILLGAGLSTVLSMVSTNTITPLGLIAACGFSVVGAFLVALHIAKD